MKKIITLLLCCGVLVSMVGCGGNTVPPPTKSLPTTVSETVITETLTDPTPPVTAVEQTEKELTPTESKDQATAPSTTTTEPTTTEMPQEETTPTEITKPTEPSAVENTEPKEETLLKAEESQEETYQGIQWPEVDPADIERLVIAKINAYRIAQGETAATILPGLTEVARYRANELTTNFEHRGEQHVSTELKYGQFVDLESYGMPEDSCYKGYSREAIGMGDWFGTAESMSDRIADGFHHSKGHWSYVGNSKYPYIAVGVTKANGKWYVCILMSDKNYGG
ncbi:MAG: hypothetical protein IJ027_01665 [Oscillospiraceae bacterium]|nr:hypothetical protein [Oscillospiraceae bacterium]